MDVNLQCLESDLEDHHSLPVYHVLKATLQYPATPEAKAAKLAEDIRFVCKPREDSKHVRAVLMDVWCLVIDIASCVPADHPWQISLAQAVVTLQRREDSVIENDKHKTLLWSDLPDLSMFARERLDNPACWEAEEAEEIRHTKNQASFFARLIAIGVRDWVNFPVWKLRDALEEPTIKGPWMESQLWIATEWVIKCADVILEQLDEDEEPEEWLARSFRGGELCKDMMPLSRKRWAFWKKRFAELAADVKDLEVDDSIVMRITDALKRMDEAENAEKVEETKRVEGAEKTEGAEKAEGVEKAEKEEVETEGEEKAEEVDNMEGVKKADEEETTDNLVKMEGVEKAPGVEKVPGAEKLEEVERVEK